MKRIWRRAWLLFAGLSAGCASGSALAPAPSDPRPAPAAAAATNGAVTGDAKSRTNPVATSADALKRGAELFSRHCTSCHGSLGKGDGPVASYWAELPKDLSDPLRQDRLSDGEIFRQISTGHIVEGKEIMPAFAARLSEQDRWKIVLFVRTLRAAAQ